MNIPMRNENTMTVPYPNIVTFMLDSFSCLIITLFEKKKIFFLNLGSNKATTCT